jgi:sugar lactone lactonase YvrE
MYYGQPQRAIYAYDFDLSSGSICGNRRAFVHTPDSGCPRRSDRRQQGYVWCAWWDGWRAVRYAPDGSVEREISVPVQRPTSCMFGGANLDELYITSARVGLSEDELNQQPFAGDLFRLRAGVRGLPEPRFAG